MASSFAAHTVPTDPPSPETPPPVMPPAPVLPPSEPDVIPVGDPISPDAPDPVREPGSPPPMVVAQTDAPIADSGTETEPSLVSHGADDTAPAQGAHGGFIAG